MFIKIEQNTYEACPIASTTHSSGVPSAHKAMHSAQLVGALWSKVMLATLDQALELAQEMATHAEQQDWEQVTALQARYSALLAQIDAQAVPASQHPQAAAQAQAIRDIEQHVQTLASDRRDTVVKEMRSQSTAQKASNAYNANARGIR